MASIDPPEWQYNTAEDLGESPSERLRKFPRQPDMLVYGLRALAAFICRLGLFTWNRLRIEGREHLPPEGSFVMVANHASHLDALCLMSALPFRRTQRVFPAAAADYFFKSLSRTWFSVIFINVLPFSRKAGIRSSLKLCRNLLKLEGNVLILFPEGTRSMDGDMHEFKPGIGIVTAGLPVPVVPCYLEGAGRAWPKGHLLPYPRRIELRIGQPLCFDNVPSGKEGALLIARELREAVEALAG